MIIGKRTKHYFLLIGLWLLAILIVNSVVETPLNDDWAYAQSVLKLLNTGIYTPGNWPGMTLIVQIYIGAAFAKIFGFSFTLLRISTLIFSLIGIVFFYELIRLLNSNSDLAFFLSVLLFFNPLYFSLSFTFMTDIYFLTFLLAAFYYYNKSLEKNNLLLLGIAGLLTALATLVRQPGILIIIAFLPSVLINKNIRPKIKIGFGLSFLFVFFVLLCYQYWIDRNIPKTGNFGKLKILTDTLFEIDASYFYKRFLTILLYPALFLLPISVGFIKRIASLNTQKKYLFYFLWAFFFILIIIPNYEFPTGNIFGNLYLGPKLLKDGYWNQNISPQLPYSLWLVIKYAAIINLSFLCSLGIILFQIKKQGKDWLHFSTENSVRITLWIFIVGFIIFLILNPIFFDRYTLPLIAVLLLAINFQLLNLQGKQKYVAYVFTGFFVLFSILATHDYLAWNRSTKRAFIYLCQKKQIRKNRIDAGFAINGWYQSGPLNPRIKNGKSWWWVSDDDYVISFGQIKGFRKEKTFSYFSFMKLKTDSIFIVFHPPKTSLPYEFFPLLCNMEKTDADKNFFLSKMHHQKFEKGFLQSDKKAFSGKFSVCLTEKEPFALLSRYRGLKPYEKFKVKVWRYGKNIDAGIVLTSDEGNGFFYYENDNVVKEKNGWVQLQLQVRLHRNFEMQKIGIFLWNKSGHEVWFVDLEIYREPK